jgi:hypothetical protein
MMYLNLSARVYHWYARHQCASVAITKLALSVAVLTGKKHLLSRGVEILKLS